MSQGYLLDLMQVIVADWISDDDTKNILGGLQSKYSQIMMVDISELIVPVGINRVLRMTRGECYLSRRTHRIRTDYLMKYLNELKPMGAENVGARWQPAEKIGKVVAMLTENYSAIGVVGFRAGHELVKAESARAVTIGTPRLDSIGKWSIRESH